MTANQILKRNAELRARKAALEESAGLLAEIALLESRQTFPGEEPASRVMRVLVNAVSLHFDVSLGVIMGRGRTFRAALARHVIFHLAAELGGMNYSQIGRILKRDHTAVMYGCQRVQSDASVDQKFADRVERLKGECAQRLVIAATDETKAKHHEN